MGYGDDQNGVGIGIGVEIEAVKTDPDTDPDSDFYSIGTGLRGTSQCASRISKRLRSSRL
jgi:hypothetical protein